MIDSDNNINTIYDMFGFKLLILPTVMIPSSYTNLLLKNIPKNLKDFRGLDLGCGCGLLAMLLAKSGCNDVLATDINSAAIKSTNENALFNNVGNIVRTQKTDMFLELNNKFDIIVFNPPSCPSLTSDRLYPNFYAGEDGRKFIDIAIKNVKKYLNKDGKFIYIQNSLSNFSKSIQMIKDEGYDYKILDCKTVEFRKEYYNQIKYFKSLKEKGICDYTESNEKSFQKIYVLELKYA